MNRIDKKGQGLPLTTIIIAAVGLIVLVVLVAIFTGRIGGFGKGVAEAGELRCTDACIASGFTEGATKNMPLGANEACVGKRILFRGDACCCKEPPAT